MVEIPPECAYRPGALLNLSFQSASLESSSVSAPSVSFNVVIEKVFAPFTKGQAMVVRPTDVGTDTDVLVISSSGERLPTTMILKLYDRRWIDDREPDEEDPIPGTPASEDALQEHRRKIESGEVEEVEHT